MANKVGRPTTYTKELATKICAEISLGESMRSVVRSKDMPAMSTVFKWLSEHKEFSEQYEIACQERTEAMAEDLLEIADNGTNDYMETLEGKTVYQGDSVQRSRLRVDTRKWLMSKMKPKKYGEKLDIEQKSEVVHKYEEMDDSQLDAIIKARKDRLSEDA